MSLPTMPTAIDAVDPRQWQSFAPFYDELRRRELDETNARDWLQDWSHLRRLVSEAGAWIYIEKTLDTTDSEKEQTFLDYITHVYPKIKVAEQALKERLLELDMPDEDLALMLRDMRNEADLFRDENVPLFTKVEKLDNEYDKITGGLKAKWNGEEKNLVQLGQLLQKKDRSVRERAWRTMMDLWLGSREKLNDLFRELLVLRRQIAANAGLPDYRAYAFREHGRFAYTPEDCFTFHEAIAEVVVPAAQRVWARRRARLGLDVLRPWDVDVDPHDAPPLKPYQGQGELVAGALQILNRVDPVLGRHFATMAEEELLDLETRQGKALGGYCSTLALRKRPFIFMNGVGIHDDVQTLLHEAGHAFHVFETADLPLTWQTDAPMEFCEVASMAMELLAAPYFTKAQGGFYTPAEAARARIEHLEGILTFLPYMAVVDAFQHWAYTHPEESLNAANCDAAWDRLWARFVPGVDWSSLEDARMTGWHRKLHIFQVPFYYIEYGMAQVGALQVWRNSRENQAAAVAAYRQALSQGGTRTLPELFTAAGAEFRFDTPMLTEIVLLVEETVAELQTQIEG